MSSRIYNNFVSIKYLFFIVFLFPFLMHIYWGIFDIYYANSIVFIGIFLLIGAIYFNMYNNTYNQIAIKYIYIFMSLISFILIHSLFFFDFKDFIKYCFYIFIFYFLFTHYMKKKYYTLFINLVSIFVFLNIFLYIIALYSNYYLFYSVDHLTLLTKNSSFITRQDWEYTLPYYLLVIPSNSFNSSSFGILQLPRMFGMSTEPTLYSIIILPTIIMALYYKKYISLILLLIALLLSSSYGAFAILFVCLIFYVLYNYRLIIFLTLLILVISFYYFNIFDTLIVMSPRLNLYGHLFMNILEIKNLQFFGTNNVTIDIPFAILNQTIKYGLFFGISLIILFMTILYHSSKYGTKMLFVFALSFIMIINKSGEVLSPIFLFYLGFLLTEINLSKRN